MLIITGTIAYDYIMDFPGKFGDHILPDQLHNINLSFIVNNFSRRRGGTAGNVSYTLGLLNTPHKLFSVAGKDFKEYKKDFLLNGINFDFVKVEKSTYTASGFAMTDSTNNQIWGYFYGAAEKNSDLELKNVVTKNDFVLIGPQGVKGSLSFVEQCIKLNLPYMFDPGFILTQISDEQLTKGLEHANYIIGNDYEINLIKKRINTWKKIFKQKIVITTLGENGATVESKGKLYKINPAKPKKIIDPTGAGDAWRGGFLAGMEKGLDIKTCAQIGAVAASFCLEEFGTQEHKYTKEEFKNRYRQTYNSLVLL